MLTQERAADGESVACGGGSEWAHEGELKGLVFRVCETERKLR